MPMTADAELGLNVVEISIPLKNDPYKKHQYHTLTLRTYGTLACRKR